MFIAFDGRQSLGLGLHTVDAVGSWMEGDAEGIDQVQPHDGLLIWCFHQVEGCCSLLAIEANNRGQCALHRQRGFAKTIQVSG